MGLVRTTLKDNKRKNSLGVRVASFSVGFSTSTSTSTSDVAITVQYTPAFNNISFSIGHPGVPRYVDNVFDATSPTTLSLRSTIIIDFIFTRL